MSKPKKKAKANGFAAWLAVNKGRVSQRGPQCSVCKLPHDTLAHVREARSTGMTFSLIALGLREAELNIGAEALARHFRDDHHGKRVLRNG